MYMIAAMTSIDLRPIVISLASVIVASFIALYFSEAHSQADPCSEMFASGFLPIHSNCTGQMPGNGFISFDKK